MCMYGIWRVIIVHVSYITVSVMGVPELKDILNYYSY